MQIKGQLEDQIKGQIEDDAKSDDEPKSDNYEIEEGKEGMQNLIYRSNYKFY